MKPIRLAQFTDTHLYGDSTSRLCGLDTADSLTRVLNLARADGWPPDAILVTGDLSQDETPASYRRFVEFFGPLGAPVHCLPGNHDIPRALAQSLAGQPNVHFTRWVDLGPWQIVLLNTVVPRDNGGELAADELEFLDRTLAGAPDRHALVCLHHHPVRLGSEWLDGMWLRNSDDFFRVIDRHSHVRGLVCGHVHQEFESERNGVTILATPSTSVQFLPKSKDFALDTRAPGYRRLELHPDGRIYSSVRRLASYAFTPDLSTRGY